MLSAALAVMYGTVHVLYSPHTHPLSFSPSLSLTGKHAAFLGKSRWPGPARHLQAVADAAGVPVRSGCGWGWWGKHGAANWLPSKKTTHSPGTPINAINNVKNVPYHQPIPTRYASPECAKIVSQGHILILVGRVCLFIFLIE